MTRHIGRIMTCLEQKLHLRAKQELTSMVLERHNEHAVVVHVELLDLSPVFAFKEVQGSRLAENMQVGPVHLRVAGLRKDLLVLPYHHQASPGINPQTQVLPGNSTGLACAAAWHAQRHLSSCYMPYDRPLYCLHLLQIQGQSLVIKGGRTAYSQLWCN